MDFAISYILSFFVCLYVGEVYYMQSDKGLFKMIGLLPVINIIVASVLLSYMLYIFIDVYLIDKFRNDRNKKGQYNKWLEIFNK